jgi:ATP-dependent exoDNAse (exonuclease V) beta subunit
MSDEERQSFADMTDDEWIEYVEEQEQKQQEQKQQQQQQQQQKNQEQQAAQMGAYYAYQGMSGASNNNQNSGNRKLYSMAEGVCDTCSEKCVDDEEEQQDEEYYKQLLEFFTDTMCMETSDGSGYIGHTCGSTGLGIELALFEDKNCMYLAANQDAYSVYESTMAQYSDQNNNGDSLGFDYMTMVTDMYSQQFSCTEGSDFGGYGNTVSFIVYFFPSLLIVSSHNTCFLIFVRLSLYHINLGTK